MKRGIAYSVVGFITILSSMIYLPLPLLAKIGCGLGLAVLLLANIAMISAWHEVEWDTRMVKSDEYNMITTNSVSVVMWFILFYMIIYHSILSAMVIPSTPAITTQTTGG